MLVIIIILQTRPLPVSNLMQVYSKEAFVGTILSFRWSSFWSSLRLRQLAPVPLLSLVWNFVSVYCTFYLYFFLIYSQCALAIDSVLPSFISLRVLRNWLSSSRYYGWLSSHRFWGIYRFARF